MERDSERKFELHRCLSILVSPPMEYQRRQLTPCGDGACSGISITGDSHRAFFIQKYQTRLDLDSSADRFKHLSGEMKAAALAAADVFRLAICFRKFWDCGS